MIGTGNKHYASVVDQRNNNNNINPQCRNTAVQTFSSSNMDSQSVLHEELFMLL